jgi:hypothetical protein
MGHNDRFDEPFNCDDCEDCEEECTEHEEPCVLCGYVNCACDSMYEAWQDRQAELYEQWKEEN